MRPEDYILSKLTVNLVDNKGYATGETYCRLAFTQSYNSVFRFGIMAMQGYTMEFDTNLESIRYAQSVNSTKEAVSSNSTIFTTRMIDPKIPQPDNCALYGGSYCPGWKTGMGWTYLSTTKLVSCLGGALIWLLLVIYAFPLLPDFESYAQVLLAKLNKLRISRLDTDLFVITHED